MKHFLGVFLLVLLAAIITVSYGSAKQPQGVVLFDAGHGQKFLISDEGPFGLSGLAAVFSAHGFKSETSSALIDQKLLQEVDILVISGPFVPYSPSEIGAMQKFLSAGGHLCLMLHIAPPVNSLLHQLGINLASGVVYEKEHVLQDNPLDFKATNLASHPLMQNIQQIHFYGAWGFQSPLDDQRVIARASNNAWVDLNRNDKIDPQVELYPYGLVLAGQIGRGRFVVFSDDAIFQNKFLTNENAVLAENLAQWLKQ